MVRGRKPKPTSQRILEGKAGHRALNHDEPKPPLLPQEPDVSPPELGTDAAAITEWRRLVPMLRLARQITEADRAILLAVCLEWSRYLAATKEVASKGMVIAAPSGYPMVNPYVSIAARALAGCARMWPELGLTPSSRARVQTTPGGNEFDEFDRPLALPGDERKPH